MRLVPRGRLSLGPSSGLTRGREVTILVDGSPTVAYEGESVAAALIVETGLATRTTPGGSPRGIYCGMGVCFDCLVVVDGVPNSRACVTLVSDGMRVERQNGSSPAR